MALTPLLPPVPKLPFSSVSEEVLLYRVPVSLTGHIGTPPRGAGVTVPGRQRLENGVRTGQLWNG